MNCPSCHKEVVPDSFFCTWCDAFTPSPEQGDKAGLFRRWVAWMLDPFLAVALFLAAYLFSIAVFGAVAEELAIVVAIVFPAVYFVWFLLLLRKGLTPGKWLLGLQVVNHQTGEIPGFAAMFIREIVGRTISGVIFGLGYLWAIFDKNAQAWHDKIAGTVVLKVAPTAAAPSTARKRGTVIAAAAVAAALGLPLLAWMVMTGDGHMAASSEPVDRSPRERAERPSPARGPGAAAGPTPGVQERTVSPGAQAAYGPGARVASPQPRAARLQGERWRRMWREEASRRRFARLSALPLGNRATYEDLEAAAGSPAGVLARGDSVLVVDSVLASASIERAVVLRPSVIVATQGETRVTEGTVLPVLATMGDRVVVRHGDFVGTVDPAALDVIPADDRIWWYEVATEGGTLGFAPTLYFRTNGGTP